MSKINRIIIVGHPGAGKGVLGRALAEKLGWTFVDADFGLEFHIGRTVAEILGNIGEESLHACESEILVSLLNRENIVVVTDAGVVCSEKNRHLLSNEFVVHLDVSSEKQIERTIRNPHPFLLHNNLKDFFDKLHDERDGLYKQVAKLTIDSDDSALGEHVSIILKHIDVNVAEKSSKRVALSKNDQIFFHKILHTPVHLSEQRALCLKLLAQGKSSKEIAKLMKISNRTVEKYLAKTAELLGCTSSKELIALYHDRF